MFQISLFLSFTATWEAQALHESVTLEGFTRTLCTGEFAQSVQIHLHPAVFSAVAIESPGLLEREEEKVK